MTISTEFKRKPRPLALRRNFTQPHAMATISTIADDFDGSTPAETVYFSVAGKDYAIDLNEEHAAELADALAKVDELMKNYTDKARPMGKSSTGTARRSSKSSKPSQDNKAVRAWAQENGYEIGDRGRIPEEIQEAYRNRSKKS